MYRAGLSLPGARLLVAANLVRAGARVADIGCDHGKLAVYLAKHGSSPHVIAVDKRPIPLSRAKALVLQSDCSDKVECRLGDGLAPLQQGEVQDIVIAGVSGETIIEILEATPWARDASLHYIFVPVTRDNVLRRWLCENGFEIRKEIPTEENRRFYSVFSVVYTGQTQQKEALFYEVGLVPCQPGAAATGYLKGRLGYFRTQAAAPLEPDKKLAVQKMMREVEQCLRSMK